MAIRPNTSNRIAHRTTGSGDEPVLARLLPDPVAADANDRTAVVVVDEDVVVDDEIVVAFTVVVVDDELDEDEDEDGDEDEDEDEDEDDDEVVVPATTVQVRPLASAPKVICTFQYLSSWVDDATPSVHASPRL